MNSTGRGWNIVPDLKLCALYSYAIYQILFPTGFETKSYLLHSLLFSLNAFALSCFMALMDLIVLFLRLNCMEQLS